MAKQQEDNLENFFLRRVNEYSIDYREEDWNKLNEMLDAADTLKSSAIKQKLLFYGSGILLIISIALLLLMSRNFNTQSRPENDPNQQTDTEISAPVTEDKADTGDEPDNLETLTTDDEGMVSESVDGNDDTGNIKVEIAADVENATDPDPGSIVPTDQSKGKTRIVISDNIEKNEHGVFNSMEGESEDSDFSSAQPVVVHISKNALNFHPALRTFQLDTQSRAIPAGIRLMRNYSWNFSVAADYSAVGSNAFSGPELRPGLSLEYFLTPRFSILTGINYSQKNYSAFGREYTPPYGFWTGGIVPDETVGSCNVLDIPINLSYYIPFNKGNALFVRTGISSWLMLEEHYYYKYKINDPDLIKYWGGENENYHYFSVVNLSAGFEQQLNNRLSILVEPYLNVPLGGVGFGKVDLHSMGLRLTFRVSHQKIATEKLSN